MPESLESDKAWEQLQAELTGRKPRELPDDATGIAGALSEASRNFRSALPFEDDKMLVITRVAYKAHEQAQDTILTLKSIASSLLRLSSSSITIRETHQRVALVKTAMQSLELKYGELVTWAKHVEDIVRDADRG